MGATMRKLLFINSCLTSGGSEKVMTMLANEFSGRGYSVSMVLLREKEDAYTVDGKVELIRFHYRSKNKIAIGIQRFFKLRKVLKTGKYNAAISFMYDINMMSLLSNIGINIPMYISERADPNSRKHSYLYHYLEEIVYSKAARLILQTEQIKSYYSKRLQKKICVIPNPIDNKTIIPYNDVRDKRIVAVGRMSPQKNFQLLINTFARFVQSHKEYTLEIYGEGVLRDELSSQIEKLKICDKVKLMGYVPDVIDRIRTSGMYISTSNYEGISNSMLEAMALGIPCICTDCPVGGAAMVISDSKDGFLIPMNDENILLDRMEFLADNCNIASELGKAATSVRARFALQRIADIWEKTITES